MKGWFLNVGVCVAWMAAAGEIVTPAAFTGTDSERIEQAIAAAVADGSKAMAIPFENGKDNVWKLDRTIRVPGGFTLQLWGCRLEMCPDSDAPILANAAAGRDGAKDERILILGLGQRKSVLVGKRGIRLENLHDCSVRNLDVRGGSPHGISLGRNCSNICLSNLRFHDCQNGIDVASGDYDMVIEYVAGQCSGPVVSLGEVRETIIREFVAGSRDGGPVVRAPAEAVKRGDVVVSNVCDTATLKEADLPIPALMPAPQKFARTRGAYVAPSAYVTRDWISFARDPSLPSEGYRLCVAPDKVTVTAADERGELHAMTTLRQLGGERMPYRHAIPLMGAERSLPLRIPCCEIEDAPAYRWRGMMIDESRHFFGKETLKHVLDGMAYHKYNVLHWHLTDDQGWRIVIDRYPKLITYGAVRPSSPVQFDFENGRQNGESYGPFFYTKDDIREIVAYASARGIEVVPEIEFPGHIRAALAGYPEFSCIGEKLTRVPRCKWGLEGEVLCVGNDAAIRFVEEVIDEVIELFPSEYFHIGGDECPTTRWKECPKCRARAKALGLSGPEKLQSWVTTHFTEYLTKKGKRVIGWDEILEGNIPTTAGVMSWRGTSGGIKASQAGHDVVICPQSHCYFNRKAGLAEDPFMPRNEREVITLEKVYSFDPVAGVPEEFRSRVMGSQACFWSEAICNRYDLDWRMWPRSCALAEVLWSAPAKRDFADFKRRMFAHRKVLIDYGVNCSPLE